MEIISQNKLKPYLPFLKWGLIIMGICLTAMLLFKDLYFYTWEEKMETIIYSIPMVFIFFLWLRYRLDEKHTFEYQLFLIDTTVVGLSALRLLGLLFHSGHVLFLLYTLMTTENKTYKWISGIMLGFTMCLKIFYWGDFITQVIGGTMALFFVWLRKKFMNKISVRCASLDL
ncbi:MAG: hypothetical protein GQ574_02170 [Crocinitomix sp.]|nr:hypothetical protein [Crocinitomix sp.]